MARQAARSNNDLSVVDQDPYVPVATFYCLPFDAPFRDHGVLKDTTAMIWLGGRECGGCLSARGPYLVCSEYRIRRTRSGGASSDTLLPHLQEIAEMSSSRLTYGMRNLFEPTFYPRKITGCNGGRGERRARQSSLRVAGESCNCGPRGSHPVIYETSSGSVPP